MKKLLDKVVQIIKPEILLCLFFILSIPLYSCQKKSDKKQTIQTKVMEPKAGGEIIVGEMASIDDLNPLTFTTGLDWNIVSQIFLPLVERNSDLTLVPMLAESWKFSIDFLTVTYNLRKDVLWSDGTPFTADDVIYSYQMYTNPKTNYRQAGRFAMIEKVEKIDAHTVKVKFKEVYSDELATSGENWIFPKHIFEKVPPENIRDSELKRNPVGCGPFKLEKWDTEKQEWSLVPNEHYRKWVHKTPRFNGYDKAIQPYLDRIKYRVFPNQESQISSLKSGEINVCAMIPVQYYTELKSNQNLKLISIPSRYYNFVGWNLRHPLFQNKNVRKALSMAVNQEEIVRKYMNGLAEIVHSPISRFLPEYNNKITKLPYNIESAKKILAEEGWQDINGDGWLEWTREEIQPIPPRTSIDPVLKSIKKGDRFKFTVITSSYIPVWKEIAFYLREQYKQLGIDMDIELWEWNKFVNERRYRRFDAFIGRWSPDYFTVADDARALWHTSQAKKEFSSNEISFSNAKIDSLIDKGSITLEPKKNKAIWNEFQEVIYDEQPITFLYSAFEIHAVTQNLKGTEVDIRGLFVSPSMEKWWIEK